MHVVECNQWSHQQVFYARFTVQLFMRKYVRKSVHTPLCAYIVVSAPPSQHNAERHGRRKQSAILPVSKRDCLFRAIYYAALCRDNASNGRVVVLLVHCDSRFHDNLGSCNFVTSCFKTVLKIAKTRRIQNSKVIH